jgi:DNA-binding NarL/FixJ family response regulator
MNQQDYRVGILEDEPMLLDAFRSLASVLPKQAGVEFVGFFAHPEEAHIGLRQLAINIMFVDQGLGPGVLGTDFIARARVAHPEVVYLVFSGDTSLELARQAAGVGARGVFPKTNFFALRGAIDAVIQGGTYFAPEVTAALLSERYDSRPNSQELTFREREVLSGIRRGLTYKEIAATRGVSVTTITTQVRSACRKLDESTGHQAAHRAARLGLL